MIDLVKAFLADIGWNCWPLASWLLVLADVWRRHRATVKRQIAENEAGAFCPHGVRRPKNCRPCNEAFLFGDEKRENVALASPMPGGLGSSLLGLAGLAASHYASAAGVHGREARQAARAQIRATDLLRPYMIRLNPGIFTRFEFSRPVLLIRQTPEQVKVSFAPESMPHSESECYQTHNDKIHFPATGRWWMRVDSVFPVEFQVLDLAVGI